LNEEKSLPKEGIEGGEKMKKNYSWIFAFVILMVVIVGELL